MHRHSKRTMRSRLGHRSVPISAPDALILEQQIRESSLVVRNEGPLKPLAVSTVMTSMTMMIYETKTIATAGGIPTTPTAQAEKQASIAPPIAPTGPAYIENRAGISPTTKHLLIAAGSIGGTIVVTFLMFLVWKRKRNRARDNRKSDIVGKEVSAPLGSNWGTYRWDNKSNITTTTKYVGSELSVDRMPEPAFLRPGTAMSNRAAPTRAPFPPPNRRSLSLDRAPPITVEPAYRESPLKSTPSSPVLPIERPPSPSERQSSVPAYLAHLANSVSPPKISRFSWTNSQAPKTPIFTPNPTVERFSVVSETESVPRYRTVESWVGVQAVRYEEARIQERIQKQIDEAIREVNDVGSQNSDTGMGGMNSPPPRQEVRAGTPDVPDLPARFQIVAEKVNPALQGEESRPVVPEKEQSLQSKHSPNSSQESNIVFAHPGTQITPPTSSSKTRSPPPPPKPLPSRMQDLKAKERHVTSGSDASLFMVHPGTKVEIPSGSFIPSVILDGKLVPRGGFARRDSYGN